MTSLNHKLILGEGEVQEAVLVPLLSTSNSDDEDNKAAKDFATQLNSSVSSSQQVIIMKFIHKKCISFHHITLFRVKITILLKIVLIAAPFNYLQLDIPLKLPET